MLPCPSDSPLMTASSSKSRFSMTAKFPKALAAAGLAAVLVGCGGGSETARMETPEEDPGPSMEDNQRTAITDAIAASDAAIKKVTTMAEPEDVAAADTALAALKTAIDAARALSETDRATYTDVYDAHVLALNTNKAARTAYIQQQEEMKMAEEKKQEEMKMAEEKKARDDAAKLWVAAIDAYNVGTVAALGNDLTGTSGLMVDFDNGSTTIELDNANGVPITSTDSLAPATGWMASRFIEEAEKKRGVIVTNRSKMSDKATDYSYTNYFYTDDTAATVKPTQPITGVNPTATTGLLTFTGTAKFTDSDFGGTRPAGFTTTNGRSAEFLNVPGTLMCASGTCTVNDNGDDTFSFGADVTFNPTLPQGGNLSDIILTATMAGDDSKYVSFGYWLTTTGSGTSLKHSIDTYAMGHGYAANNASITGSIDDDDFTGSATYTGGAAGVYVLKIDPSAENPDLYDGEFVADVELKAQFDTPSRLEDEWKITGTIDNFRSATSTDHKLSGWDLDLSADFGARNAATKEISAPDLGLQSATTEGGGKSGTWAAAFYGTNTSQALDIEAVVGEFDGHFVDGHVVGAFGATKD